MIMGEGVSTGAWVKEKEPRLLGSGRMGGEMVLPAAAT